MLGKSRFHDQFPTQYSSPPQPKYSKNKIMRQSYKGGLILSLPDTLTLSLAGGWGEVPTLRRSLDEAWSFLKCVPKPQKWETAYHFFLRPTMRDDPRGEIFRSSHLQCSKGLHRVSNFCHPPDTSAKRPDDFSFPSYTEHPDF